MSENPGEQKVIQKSVLGKGLGALLPGAGSQAGQATAAPTQTPTSENGVPPPAGPTGATSAGPATFVSSQPISTKDRIPGVAFVLTDEIIVNPFQPRREFDETSIKELAQSIEANGIIQPLVVRKTGDGFQLIAGERRLRAAKQLGLKQVPVLVRQSTDKESLEIALIENIQRENLNCVDEALAYLQLTQEFALSQEQISERVGKDRATVANYLRLLRLPEAIIEDLKSNAISFGHGKALLSIDDNALRLKVRKEIVDRGLSVRDTEALVQSLKDDLEKSEYQDLSKKAETPADPVKARLFNLTQELTRTFATKVEVKGNDRRGKIVLHYRSREDLDRLLHSLKHN